MEAPESLGGLWGGYWEEGPRLVFLNAFGLEKFSNRSAPLRALRPPGPEIRLQKRFWTPKTAYDPPLAKPQAAHARASLKGTSPGLVGATVPLAVGRQASVLDRPAPSMSRSISAADH